MSSITVGYWTIRGLAAPLRMMVCYSGRPLENIMYDAAPTADGGFDKSSWFDEKPALKKKNPFINLPYVIDGDTVISQTNACLSYLGRSLDMFGDNPIEASEAEQLLCELMDLRNLTTGHAYGRSKQTSSEHLDNITSGILQKFEEWFSRDGASDSFLVGKKASAPDFHLWEMLTQAKCLAERDGLADPLITLPRLNTFYKSFTALPGNSKYLSSNLIKLPFNNKFAPFGGATDMHAWKAGTEYDFDQWSGSIY